MKINGQMKRAKRTNNGRQNITQKAKDLNNLQDGCSSAKQQIGDKQWSTKHYTES